MDCQIGWHGKCRGTDCGCCGARTYSSLRGYRAVGLILDELDRLRAIERRAQDVVDEGAPTGDPVEHGAVGAALRILGQSQ